MRRWPFEILRSPRVADEKLACHARDRRPLTGGFLNVAASTRASPWTSPITPINDSSANDGRRDRQNDNTGPIDPLGLANEELSRS